MGSSPKGEADLVLILSPFPTSEISTLAFPSSALLNFLGCPDLLCEGQETKAIGMNWGGLSHGTVARPDSHLGSITSLLFLEVDGIHSPLVRLGIGTNEG